MAAARFASIDAYLAAQDAPHRRLLTEIVAAIGTEFPALEGKLAWNVPQFQLDDAYVVGLSAAKKHVAISPWSPSVMAALAEPLADYDTTANLVRLPLDWTVDVGILRILIEGRLAELAEAAPN